MHLRPEAEKAPAKCQQEQPGEAPDDKIVRFVPRARPEPERVPDPSPEDDVGDDDPGPAAA